MEAGGTTENAPTEPKLNHLIYHDGKVKLPDGMQSQWAGHSIHGPEFQSIVEHIKAAFTMVEDTPGAEEQNAKKRKVVVEEPANTQPTNKILLATLTDPILHDVPLANVKQSKCRIAIYAAFKMVLCNDREPEVALKAPLYLVGFGKSEWKHKNRVAGDPAPHNSDKELLFDLSAEGDATKVMFNGELVTLQKLLIEKKKEHLVANLAYHHKTPTPTEDEPSHFEVIRTHDLYQIPKHRGGQDQQ